MMTVTTWKKDTQKLNKKTFNFLLIVKYFLDKLKW